MAALSGAGLCWTHGIACSTTHHAPTLHPTPDERYQHIADVRPRQRLTRGYIGRGGVRLRTGDAAGARADLREARRTAPEIWRRKALRACSSRTRAS